MIVAVTLNHCKCLQSLIESGARLDLETGKGDTALQVATRTRHKTCLELLKAAKKVN